MNESRPTTEWDEEAHCTRCDRPANLHVVNYLDGKLYCTKPELLPSERKKIIAAYERSIQKLYNKDCEKPK